MIAAAIYINGWKESLHQRTIVAFFVVVVIVGCFHVDRFPNSRLQETPTSIMVKAEPAEVASSPKDGSSPKSDVGEMNSTSWVVDSSGFLSPTGPVLKEVLDMVDGVSGTNKQTHRTASKANMRPIDNASI